MSAACVIEVLLGGTEPLTAAARFHAEYLPQVEEALTDCDAIVLRFDHTEEKPHRWRREAVAALARKYAPKRVNAVAPTESRPDESKVLATIAFLSGNAGVTGQLLIAG